MQGFCSFLLQNDDKFRQQKEFGKKIRIQEISNKIAERGKILLP